MHEAYRATIRRDVRKHRLLSFPFLALLEGKDALGWQSVIEKSRK